MAAFRLHSNDAAFNERVGTLFDSLESVSTELQPEEGNKRSAPSEDSDDIELEFRKPHGLPPQCENQRQGHRRTYRRPMNSPDYVKNPHKWIKYSMKDTQCLNDAQNKEVGLQLMQELKTRAETCKNVKDEREEEEKIIFRKPPKTCETACPSENRKEALNVDIFGGPKKLVMSEYEVGKTKCRPKTAKAFNKNLCNEEVKQTTEVNKFLLSFTEDEEDG